MADDTKVISLLEAGLEAEGVRQKAIAGNLANINTPGYRRQGVRFEQILARAIDRGGSLDRADVTAQVYQPKDTRVDANGNDVVLDVEVGEMVKNSLRHEAYMLVLKKKYAQIQEAIRVP